MNNDFFSHSWGDLPMIFTRDFVTRENHWQITPVVTKKSLFTVTHALFFICKLDSIKIGKGIPQFDCHISLYRLTMPTSENFLDIHNGDINPFTILNCHEMFWLESFSSRGCLTWSCFVYIRLPLWRHRACIATYLPRKAAMTWSWWYRFNCR